MLSFNKILILIILITACSFQNRKIANFNQELDLEFEVNWCLRSENLNTFSLVPELYLITGINDSTYEVIKYQPRQVKKEFSFLIYEDENAEWEMISEMKMTFKYVHSHLIRTTCPRFL